MLPLRRGREPPRPEGDTPETPGRVQPHSLFRESVTGGDLHRHWAFFTGRGLSSQESGLASQALGLASWVEFPEVLDVPGVEDGYPVLGLQAHGARPGDMDDPERALPHG